MMDSQKARRFWLEEAAYWLRCFNSLMTEVRAGRTVRFNALRNAACSYGAAINSAKECAKEAMLIRNYGHLEANNR